ncbi:MAG: DUF433 domain-containing protein, partial [Candidatus Omnitrophica bacterium]|nr:DUF433 domain-containing protein [Candidatus Omnitrophota bacterium]
MIDKELIKKRISVAPNIHHGKPCVAGTRTPAHVILEALATGMNIDDIKKEFAPITTDDVNACLLYAALLADERELIPQA